MKLLLGVNIFNTLCMFQAMDTIKVVSADRMVRYIFNNGVEPTTTTACTAEDDAKIDALFGPTAVINRRDLFDSDEKVTTGSDERHLYPLICKDNCAGFKVKTCRATNCIGYRRDRELEEKDSIVKDERYLQTNLTCSAHMSLINWALDNLISKNLVSNTCKSYLDKAKRALSCYDDVIYGEILGMKVWDSGPSPAVLMNDNLPATGYSFCSNVQFTMTSINHPCVDWVLFELSGPNGYNHTHTENWEPYSLFYDPKGQLDGNSVQPGLYTLKVTPDGQSRKTKVFTFNVINCDIPITSEISAVKVWDSGPDPTVLMKDNMPIAGYSFCTSKQFTMSVTTQPIVTWVVFQLTSTTNGYNHTHTERIAPFTLFYDAIGKFDGNNVPPGLYTLRVLPNGQSTKARIYTFNVNNC